MSKETIKELSVITIGIILVAISLEYFFIPNNIAAGGLSGLAIVINNYIPAISPGPLVFIMDSILFIVGFIFLGKDFGIKAIYASFSLSIVMTFIEKFLNPQGITNDILLASIFGAFISAIGMAIIFNVNAGTGGTDTIAKILNKYFHTDIGKSLLGVDFIITLLGAITFGIDIGLYALLSVITNGVLIDRLISGFNACKDVTIISNKNEEISKFIIEELERGCTFLNGIGGFYKEEKVILYTVLGRNEFIRLKQHISKIDKQAFITVGEVHEVMGEGFKELQ